MSIDTDPSSYEPRGEERRKHVGGPQARQVRPITFEERRIPDRRGMGLLASSDYLEAIDGSHDSFDGEELSDLNFAAKDLEADYSVPRSSEPSSSQADKEAGKSNPNWLRRNTLKLALGGFALTAAYGLVNSPYEETRDEVIEAAPWVVGGLIASEAMWIAGAGMMAGGAGRNVGNPLKLHGRWNELAAAASESKLFHTGLAVNTVGAIGTAGVIVGGAVEALPPATWPAAFSLAAVDVASTVAIRAGVYQGLKDVKKAPAKTAESAKTKEVAPTVRARHATIDDIDRLADIDLELFDSAYGATPPDKQQVVEMLTQRYNNNPDWMFVAEVNGKVEGFISAFRTDVPVEGFASWEKSTADGTLDGKVVPDGKYVYVTNMTMGTKANEAGAREMVAGQLFANAIEGGAEYGYFESRMSHFKKWLGKTVEGDPSEKSPEQLQVLAEEYMNLKTKNGKRRDPLLRMFEGMGYSLSRVVPDAFQDDASMNFGVVGKIDIPPVHPMLKRSSVVRRTYAAALRTAAKYPKVIGKIV